MRQYGLSGSKQEKMIIKVDGNDGIEDIKATVLYYKV